MTAWVQMYSGAPFDMEEPNQVLSMRDASMGLAKLRRHRGLVDVSVATHSVHVATLLAHKGPAWQLAGALHDLPESIYGDIPSPVLRYMASNGCDVRSVLRALDEKVYLAFANALAANAPAGSSPLAALRRYDEAMELVYRSDLRNADLVALATDRELLAKRQREWIPLPELDPAGLAFYESHMSLSPEDQARVWADLVESLVYAP